LVRPKLIIAILAITVLFVYSPCVLAQEDGTLLWHPSVKPGAIFGWKITTVDLFNSSNPFILGGKQLDQNDVLQFRFTGYPPTRGSQFFELQAPPTWVYMYENGNQVDYTQMEEEGMYFLVLILPIHFNLDNGTSFDLTEMNRLGAPEDMVGFYSSNSTHVNTTFVGEWAYLHYVTSLETGVALSFTVLTPDVGNITFDYFAEAANVNEEGEATQIDPSYSQFVDSGFSSTPEIVLVIGAAGGVVLIIVVIVALRSRRHVV
jgi:hypothetical protein